MYLFFEGYLSDSKVKVAFFSMHTFDNMFVKIHNILDLNSKLQKEHFLLASIIEKPFPLLYLGTILFFLLIFGKISISLII
jgi:hypothetical protein